MPSWFSKVFKGDAAKPKPIEKKAPAPVARVRPTAPPPDQSNDTPKRTVVHAPILADEPVNQSENADTVRIKARVEPDQQSCVILVGQPLLDGFSIWIPTPESKSDSPLAEKLYEVDGVTSVLIHNFTITVNRSPLVKGDWEPMIRDLGARIRTFLESGESVVADSFLQDLPNSETIEAKLETVIKTEINPGIASHSGSISLSRVEGNTVYIEMMGGCQGCAASDITLRQGIHQAFREAVPQIGAILDTTDHTAGSNPYFTELPVGM
jgi:Fe-S cluster biogenesis protein NfuA